MKNIIVLVRIIREKINDLVVSELVRHGIKGIVPSHGHILATLFSGQSYTIKQLSEIINRTSPTVTVLVDKLATYGYIVKGKNHIDGRATFITLSEKGHSLRPSFDEISKVLNATVYHGFSEEELDVLERLLQRMYKNLS